MTPIHVQKQSYEGYCVGTCIEYPDIVMYAETDEDLKIQFKEALPIHIAALKRHKIDDKSQVEVITVE